MRDVTIRMPLRLLPPVVPPLVAWAVAVAMLVVSPGLDAADSEVAGIPRLGAAGWWFALLVLTAQAVVLLGRRARPLTVLLAVAAGSVVMALGGAGDATSLTSAAVLVAVWSAATGADLPRRRWQLLGALLGAGLLVALGGLLSQVDIGLPTGSAVLAGLVQGVGVILAPALLAVVVRARREAREARSDLAVAVDREQSAQVAAAIAEERTAMARELHDIAAHHLTGIAVMTGAVERQIDTDPAGAKEAVRQVRTQSTAMLRELRGLVTLLRAPDDPAEAGEQERLSHLPDLVAGARRTGLDVDLEILGSEAAARTGVGPLAQLSAYRTVQESLANAARHAPGARCQVVLDASDPASIVLTVRNGPATGPASGAAPSPARRGLGLVGMRERADLTDSTLEAGPTADGGWQTRLRMPATVTAAEEVAG
ncbi:histidine kinase [Nocardioides albertanoniae]|uniref:histidine kinase n=1 Tax=Nocardioides albertanoniae TaxID=1175486 RepID=A0A543A5H7_9ACTN|nr:histidine kinase [Nocardioides albertanoniae]TQL67843.1 histidine kinase [Nocardioides albertanoniae]